MLLTRLLFPVCGQRDCICIKEGVVTANKTGTTKITVNASDGTEKKETVIVTVRAPGSPVRLQDDFYQAINATILNEHALQGNQYEWDGFNELQNRITNDLNSLLDELVAQKEQYKEGTIQQKIINFYMLDSDMDTRNKLGTEPLKPYIDKIDNAQTVAEFVNVLAELGKAGQGSIFTFQVTQDIIDSNKYVLTDNGPSYILSKEYMTGDANKPVQQAVLEFIKKIFVMAGESEEKASEIASQVFNFEQELAVSGLGMEDRYDINKIYHPYTKDELKKTFIVIVILKGYFKKLLVLQILTSAL